MASNLISSTEYLTATGEAGSPPSADKLAQIGWALTAASTIIRNYLDRDVVLASEATTGSRTFRYNGSGVLEIDDATAITAVATSITPWNLASRILNPIEYIAASTSPNLPVFDYIEMWSNLPFAQSPAMGFNWNEDRYGWRPQPVELDVTAVWGWPAIPDDIKQACVWQVADLLVPESPYITESIESYSHSFRQGLGSSGGGSAPPITAVTPRAQSLLDAYVRVNV